MLSSLVFGLWAAPLSPLSFLQYRLGNFSITFQALAWCKLSSLDFVVLIKWVSYPAGVALKPGDSRFDFVNSNLLNAQPSGWTFSVSDWGSAVPPRVQVRATPPLPNFTTLSAFSRVRVEFQSPVCLLHIRVLWLLKIPFPVRLHVTVLRAPVAFPARASQKSFKMKISSHLNFTNFFGFVLSPFSLELKPGS